MKKNLWYFDLIPEKIIGRKAKKKKKIWNNIKKLVICQTREVFQQMYSIKTVIYYVTMGKKPVVLWKKYMAL